MATEDENDYKSEVRSREAERDLQPGEDNINVAHMIKINDSQNSVLHLERRVHKAWRPAVKCRRTVFVTWVKKNLKLFEDNLYLKLFHDIV